MKRLDDEEIVQSDRHCAPHEADQRAENCGYIGPSDAVRRFPMANARRASRSTAGPSPHSNLATYADRRRRRTKPATPSVPVPRSMRLAGSGVASGTSVFVMFAFLRSVP